MNSTTPDQVVKERIVVGVDGSQASTDALQWAARQATLTGAHLQAVTAWQFPMASSGYLLNVEDDWHPNAQALLDKAIDNADLPEGLSISRHAIEGHPARVLVEAATGAQLLVIGSRGHGGFTGMLLGSVSVHAVAHAPCPVLVLRHQPHG
ncbi:MAG: universal stress protein [Allobranchiibius sp.]